MNFFKVSFLNKYSYLKRNLKRLFFIKNTGQLIEGSFRNFYFNIGCLLLTVKYFGKFFSQGKSGFFFISVIRCLGI